MALETERLALGPAPLIALGGDVWSTRYVWSVYRGVWSVYRMDRMDHRDPGGRGEGF